MGHMADNFTDAYSSLDRRIAEWIERRGCSEHFRVELKDAFTVVVYPSEAFLRAAKRYCEGHNSFLPGTLSRSLNYEFRFNHGNFRETLDWQPLLVVCGLWGVQILAYRELDNDDGESMVEPIMTGWFELLYTPVEDKTQYPENARYEFHLTDEDAYMELSSLFWVWGDLVLEYMSQSEGSLPGVRTQLK